MPTLHRLSPRMDAVRAGTWLQGAAHVRAREAHHHAKKTHREPNRRLDVCKAAKLPRSRRHAVLEALQRRFHCPDRHTQQRQRVRNQFEAHLLQLLRPHHGCLATALEHVGHLGQGCSLPSERAQLRHLRLALQRVHKQNVRAGVRKRGAPRHRLVHRHGLPRVRPCHDEDVGALVARVCRRADAQDRLLARHNALAAHVAA
mmetsp:Transcript_21324/g.63904  ORF Transcript_21324/g.63904 Transcript_21324/m.63904 type:complete len:202 (+) Transcript_21324:1412-2017(+)